MGAYFTVIGGDETLSDGDDANDSAIGDEGLENENPDVDVFEDQPAVVDRDQPAVVDRTQPKEDLTGELEESAGSPLETGCAMATSLIASFVFVALF